MLRILDDFLEQYPDAEHLETVNGASRWSNGLEEGSEDESVWFCDSCDHEIADYVCEVCEDEERIIATKKET